MERETAQNRIAVPAREQWFLVMLTSKFAGTFGDKINCLKTTLGHNCHYQQTRTTPMEVTCELCSRRNSSTGTAGTALCSKTASKATKHFTYFRRPNRRQQRAPLWGWCFAWRLHLQWVALLSSPALSCKYHMTSWLGLTTWQLRVGKCITVPNIITLTYITNRIQSDTIQYGWDGPTKNQWAHRVHGQCTPGGKKHPHIKNPRLHSKLCDDIVQSCIKLPTSSQPCKPYYVYHHTHYIPIQSPITMWIIVNLFWPDCQLLQEMPKQL